MTTAWIYEILGWALFSAGALWAIAALFRDRSKGRRRCPRCWYSMDRVPGLQCPECGHAAGGEHRLLRTRRRWRIASVALLLLILGVALRTVPTYLHAGWYGLIPSAYLAHYAPVDLPPPVTPPRTPGVVTLLTDPTFMGQPKVIVGVPGSTVVVQTGGTPAPMRTASASLREEAWLRLAAGRLTRRQSQTFLDRYFRRFPMTHTFPERWHLNDEAPYVLSGQLQQCTARIRLGEHRWTRIPNRALTVYRVATPSEPAPADATIELLLNDRVAFSTTLKDCIELAPSRAELLKKVTGAAADARVLRLLSPRLVLSEGQPLLRVDDTLAENGVEFGVFFTVSIAKGGRELATARGSLAWGASVWKDWEDIPLTLAEGVTPDQLPGATLTITADPARATDIYEAAALGRSAACWGGQLRTPLRLERQTTPPEESP